MLVFTNSLSLLNTPVLLSTTEDQKSKFVERQHSLSSVPLRKTHWVSQSNRDRSRSICLGHGFTCLDRRRSCCGSHKRSRSWSDIDLHDIDMKVNTGCLVDETSRSKARKKGRKGED